MDKTTNVATEAALIEASFEKFKQNHAVSMRLLSPIVRKNYLTIARHLIERERMSSEILVSLARRIKPLMRVSGKDFLWDGLYWCQSEPLRQSFYYNFSEDSVVYGEDGNILPVEGLEKVCTFIGYHRYGGHHMFLRPSMDEVIQQFPPHLWADETAEYAIELKFDTLDLAGVYDRVLDRHVSTVIVYRLKNGLPQQIRDQDVRL